ncbi:hypothetical protein BLNAU_18864 [Blattamonas nauphoetae]|uniref:LysM domain-containing protein n=1 Tax=Blattamonas nauphoetae TaxID=2049346 RepID=A0ABQ9X3P0_9EUKA|nr:hypothetical protein BLNAU_18864 [Blattamonas nauphoetae]
MSGGDVEGVLNSGVVEGLCKQSSMIVSCGDGIGRGCGLSVLKSLDSLCMGLKYFLRNDEQSKKTEAKKKMNEGKKEESESRYSVVNRSRAALSEIEWTLRSMIVEIGREEERGGEDEGRSEIGKLVGWILIRHFPSSFVGLGEKKEGVIGIDVERLRVEMEENEKRRKKMNEERRKKEREEWKQKEEERRKEFERQMAELQAERETNQHLIKEGLERQKEKEEERRRQSKVGAAVIELFHSSNYSLSGNMFTKQKIDGGCLVSFEFGAVVARLSLIVGSISANHMIGVISSALAANAQTTSFYNLKGGAGGWDLHPSTPRAWLNANASSYNVACLAGAAGQRVVIEADGREGRRTVRMSQDGQTQPTFFTNIPVPFRFAVYIHVHNDSVTIESKPLSIESVLEELTRLGPDVSGILRTPHWNHVPLLIRDWDGKDETLMMQLLDVISRILTLVSDSGLPLANKRLLHSSLDTLSRRTFLSNEGRRQIQQVLTVLADVSDGPFTMMETVTVQSMEQELSTLKQHSSEMERRIQQLTAQVTRAEEEKRRAEERASQAQQGRQTAVNQKESVERQNTSLSNQVTRLRNDLNQANAEIEAKKTKIKELREKMKPKAAADRGIVRSYTVVSGDKLEVIARKLGTTVDALVQRNGIRDRHRIYPGDILYY